MTRRGTQSGAATESSVEASVGWGEGLPKLSGLRGCWKAQREPSLAPRMPCHHGEALECADTQ